MATTSTYVAAVLASYIVGTLAGATVDHGAQTMFRAHDGGLVPLECRTDYECELRDRAFEAFPTP